LQRQFASRSVHKVYFALLEGVIDPEKGRIAAPIGRHPVERKRQAVLPVDPHTGESKGRTAITDYQTIGLYSTRLVSGQMGNFTLVEAVIQTGRTHQIRVHFAWMKHPVVGDTLYGYRKQRLPIERQFLHAHKLRFRLPGSGEEREFVSPLPADLQSILDSMQ
jgi:23S rRNA pseudouridine1911/1915/1917 synthase